MSIKIGIIGLGYVGLPLAALFAEKYMVIGFDIDEQKMLSLQNGIDPNGLSSFLQLTNPNLQFSNNINDLKSCTHLIITIPTDIDAQNKPDLGPLKKATEMLGSVLQKGMTIVFESTVYPGLTEEICIPILEQTSGLIWKQDFFVGYSPERINPGDTQRPIASILKIVAADLPTTLTDLSNLYSSVITAGIYQAPSIKIAEAAKVIENAQRDLNIAFVNELALIFDRMGIDTREVLKAAATKWNFMPFEPGLVGGQCIGVDPYYLTHKAEELGYSPRVIHSGRLVNNEMGKFIAEKAVKTLLQAGKNITQCRILVLGCSFKENIGDTRNSKVFDIVKELMDYSVQVEVVDPIANETAHHVSKEKIIPSIPVGATYDAIILAVKHDAFKALSIEKLTTHSTSRKLYLFDVKAFYNRDEAKKICTFYWRL
ncbi:MAG: nucleotide sugar dehydrogenase [Bacteroidota bacterium]